jgi:sugar lactone lactonase YvrE
MSVPPAASGSYAVKAATAPADTLGECPLWDERRGGLWWIDVKRHLVQFTDPRRPGVVDSWVAPGPVGCIALTDDERIAVFGSAIWSLDPELGFTTIGARPDAANSRNRFNDGRVDRWGRLWIGTMDDDEVDRCGTLYRYAPGTLDDPQVLRTNVGIPNAMAFAPDGTRAYCADSWGDHIAKFELDRSDGAIGAESVFAPVPRPGAADGACIDADGYLWTCLWGGARVVRFRPDGSIEREIGLPVSQPTCPTFGGPELSTLFVTTAVKGLSHAERVEQPLGGAVLAIDLAGSGIYGTPENKFSLPV